MNYCTETCPECGMNHASDIRKKEVTQERIRDYRKRIRELEAKLAEREWVSLLDQLITEETSSVTIHPSNVGFEGPNEMILVDGLLTGFKEIIYTGGTRLKCFEKAVADLLPPTEDKK